MGDFKTKANEFLNSAAGKVERAGLTKWILVGLAVLLLILVGTWATAAHATGVHYIPPVVVAKPPVVAYEIPVIANPPPSAPSAPAQQPSGGGRGSGSPGVAGWIAVGIVLAFFTETIRQHYAFCAQREEEWHRDKKVARCYNAERDGLPEAKR